MQSDMRGSRMCPAHVGLCLQAARHASGFVVAGSCRRCRQRRRQALIDAVRSDDRARWRHSDPQGADVNAREEDGATALAWAATRSNIAIAELLLKAGADPNLTNELGIGPLSLAIANGSARDGAALAREGRRSECGAGERRDAADDGRAAGPDRTSMKLLLDRGANVNARDKKFGQTALMWAAGHPAAVRLLVEHGADVRASTATWDVKYTIYAPTTVTLGKTGIPWNTDGEYTSKKGGQNALFFAVQKHDLESARMLSGRRCRCQLAAADGTTPLLAALYHWDPPNSVFIPGKGAPAPAGRSQTIARRSADGALSSRPRREGDSRR